MEAEEQTNLATREVGLRLVVSARDTGNHTPSDNRARCCGKQPPSQIQLRLVPPAIHSDNRGKPESQEETPFPTRFFGWRSVWSAIGWLGGGLLLKKISQVDIKKTTNATLATTDKHTHTHTTHTHTITHTHTHTHTPHTHTCTQEAHTHLLGASAKRLAAWVCASAGMRGRNVRSG